MPALFGLIHEVLRPMQLKTVLDVGCGRVPQILIKNATRHLCVDPYQPSLDSLGGLFETRCADALTILNEIQHNEFEAIVMLDVIEHMPKEMGREVIMLACRKAARVVVIFTPLGFVHQDKDDYHHEGEWHPGLRHLCGWTPDEFEGAWLFAKGAHVQGREVPIPCFFALALKAGPPC